jgi:hypothetical protein
MGWAYTACGESRNLVVNSHGRRSVESLRQTESNIETDNTEIGCKTGNLAELTGSHLMADFSLKYVDSSKSTIT